VTGYGKVNSLGKEKLRQQTAKAISATLENPVIFLLLSIKDKPGAKL